MSFSTMLEILKEKEKGKIILIRLGAFYIAVGEDAVVLHKELQLKCTCFKNRICKVGFPVNSLEEYIEKLEKLPYGYIVYDYDKPKVELKEKIGKVGKHNKEKSKNINCLLCKGMGKRYEEDEYAKALKKLLEKEEREKEK